MPLPPPHVVILSPGAKVSLVRALAEAVATRGGHLTAWETDPYAPAATVCHDRTGGGPTETEMAVSALLQWCVAHRVALVVPTRHDDLPALAAARERFAAAGIVLAVSSPECVRLCHDKAASHEWLLRGDFPVPAQTTVGSVASSRLRDAYPLVAKHPNGSGGRAIRICRSPDDLEGLPPDWILQSHASGREHTVNVYVDRGGRSVCEIPHERLLVSEGEVVRGRTARVPVLMNLSRRIAETLPAARGPLNIQIFWEEKTRRATVIEINPRFGGGYPLCHRAGGHFTDWLLCECCDGTSPVRLDDWKDNLLMVRYRESLFFDEEASASAPGDSGSC